MNNRLLLVSAGAGIASMAIVVPAALAASNGTGFGGNSTSSNFVQAPTDDDGTTTAPRLREGPGGVHFSLTEAAAEALGITVEELRAALGEEQSILDYAVARGEDSAAFTAEVAAAVRGDIEDALAAGTITEEQATAALEDLDARVAEKLASTSPLHGGRHRGGGGAGCDDDGAAPDGSDSDGTTPEPEATPDDASTEA